LVCMPPPASLADAPPPRKSHRRSCPEGGGEALEEVDGTEGAGDAEAAGLPAGEATAGEDPVVVPFPGEAWGRAPAGAEGGGQPASQLECPEAKRQSGGDLSMIRPL